MRISDCSSDVCSSDLGLPSVRRIERGIRYVVRPAGSLLGVRPFTTDQQAAIARSLHDRMTEAALIGEFDARALFSLLAGKPGPSIDILVRGRGALVEAEIGGAACRESVWKEV